MYFISVLWYIIHKFTFALKLFSSCVSQIEQSLCDENNWVVATKDATVPGNAKKAVLKNLETGKKYKFRITALNKAGSSPITELGAVVCAASVGK